MNRKAFLEINLDSIEANFRSLKDNFKSEDFICPMIKDNAYGHGLIQVGKALCKVGAKNLGVCRVEEGIELRTSGVQTQILVFGDYDFQSCLEMVQNQLTPVLSSWRQLEDFIKITRQNHSLSKMNVHIKFDTGMNRLGFNVDDVFRLNEVIKENPKFKVDGVLTHLVNSENALDKKSLTYLQLMKFQKILKQLKFKPSKIHCLNSAAILNKAKSKTDSYLSQTSWGLRPGLIIYGINPLKKGSPFGLSASMSLKSKPALIRKIKKGSTVSYGGTWIAPKDSYIAVIPLGYGDGFSRRLSNKCYALCEGVICPQVGNICMDLLMLDITLLIKKMTVDVVYEKEFTLLGHDAYGNEISASSLAKSIGTIPWEILVGFQDRLPRVYIRNKKID